ncbi:hypothetical protein LOTGIDRAFT_168047 [Lottia gigantea]|uniref:Uncharacterized protein n=1 Tax=Lottia gigantea TaxID=225164 RepID=V3ZRR0_LOTGI|nr:hypothetical protein LOTGIDRAFT_168047 [Lottia gigantea]ESO85240.1 hypothetical protein LOTGIDRAFT_168047 [Lottia gigantea]
MVNTRVSNSRKNSHYNPSVTIMVSEPVEHTDKPNPSASHPSSHTRSHKSSSPVPEDNDRKKTDTETSSSFRPTSSITRSHKSSSPAPEVHDRKITKQHTETSSTKSHHSTTIATCNTSNPSHLSVKDQPCPIGSPSSSEEEQKRLERIQRQKEKQLKYQELRKRASSSNTTQDNIESTKLGLPIATSTPFVSGRTSPTFPLRETNNQYPPVSSDAENGGSFLHPKQLSKRDEPQDTVQLVDADNFEDEIWSQADYMMEENIGGYDSENGRHHGGKNRSKPRTRAPTGSGDLLLKRRKLSGPIHR